MPGLSRGSKFKRGDRHVFYEREVTLLRQLKPVLASRHYGDEFSDPFIAIATARARRLVCLIERTGPPPDIAANDQPRWWAGRFSVWETSLGKTILRMKHEKAIGNLRGVGATRAEVPSKYPTVVFVYPDGRIARPSDLRVIGGAAPLDNRDRHLRATIAGMATPDAPSGAWRALVADTCWLTYDEIVEVPGEPGEVEGGHRKYKFPVEQGKLNLRYIGNVQGVTVVDNDRAAKGLFKREGPFVPLTSTICIGEGILGAAPAELLGTLSHEVGHAYQRMYQNYLVDLWRSESRRRSFSDWLADKRVRKKQGLDVEADVTKGWSDNGAKSIEAKLLHPFMHLRKLELLMLHDKGAPKTSRLASSFPNDGTAAVAGALTGATNVFNAREAAARKRHPASVGEIGRITNWLSQAMRQITLVQSPEEKRRYKGWLDWSQKRCAKEAVEIAAASDDGTWEILRRGLKRNMRTYAGGIEKDTLRLIFDGTTEARARTRKRK